VKIVKLFNCFFILCALTFTITAKDLLNIPWGSTFTLRPTESGDTISIGAVFYDSATVYLYNIAAGTVVTYDTNNTLKGVVKLATIGRQTYAGDDFVVRNGEFIFLNTIDRRLDIYEAFSGKYLHSVAYPDNALSGQPSRSYRFINRIFLSDHRILLGNDHVVFYLDESLGKKDATLKTISAPQGQRFAFVNSNRRVTVQGSTVRGATCSRCKVPATHFSVNGKRFFLINTKPYSLVLSRTGVQVVRIP
jgi:hypothetical protein